MGCLTGGPLALVVRLSLASRQTTLTGSVSVASPRILSLLSSASPLFSLLCYRSGSKRSRLSSHFCRIIVMASSLSPLRDLGALAGDA